MLYRPELETAAPEAIRNAQLARLNDLLSRVLPSNSFYAAKAGTTRIPVSWTDFERFPFTTKGDLVADQEASPPLGTIATYPPDQYVVYHQTSGTTGRPLMVLDTAESWNWWAECWRYVYGAAGVRASDRIFFAFSFGPFIGFWSAYAGARRLGALTVPGGGLDSKGRLQLMRRAEATVLVSTPTYALRLAEVAQAEGISTRDMGVRTRSMQGSRARRSSPSAPESRTPGARAPSTTRAQPRSGRMDSPVPRAKGSTSTKRNSLRKCSTRQVGHAQRGSPGS